jgi:hypothetical protein
MDLGNVFRRIFYWTELSNAHRAVYEEGSGSWWPHQQLERDQEPGVSTSSSTDQSQL